MDFLRPLMLVSPHQFKTIHIKGKYSPTNCRQRHLRLPVDCPICGRPSLYSYYGARCCESCKQFFRRIIVKQIDLGNCIKGGECQIQNGIRCNICRLDRCLQAGMDPLQVNVQNSENYGQFLIKLMQRREYNKIKYEEFILDSELKMMNSATGECSFLDSLLFLENKQRRVWNSISELPISYLERFNSIEEFLRYPGNILAKAEQFPENVSSNWNKENYTAKCEQFGIAIPENFACLAIDRFLLVEMAKTLPFFRRLDLKDQISLLRHISMPVGILLNAFYSASMGADTWTRANGLTFISGYLENKRFNGIGRICALSRKKLCTSVAQVKKAELGREEFVLLMAILYSSSTSENLSKMAKELLYSESVRHSRSLLKFLQEKFGLGRGAAKYAECIHLIELIWDIEYIVQMLITYLDTFNLNQAKLMKPSTIPKALMAII